MADTGKQSPLGVNGLGSILNNTGFNINPVAESYMGLSRNNWYHQFGKVVNDTCLLWLSWAINDGFRRGYPNDDPEETPEYNDRTPTVGNQGPTLLNSVYNKLIDVKGVGNSLIRGLGNAIPETYIVYKADGTPVDPAHEPPNRPMWQGQATTGYALRGNKNQAQSATWRPYVVDANTPGTSVRWTNHSVTQWGWVACHALQAWNEFNWNGWIPYDLRYPTRRSPAPYNEGYKLPEYKEFTSSFLTADNFVNYSNDCIFSMENSKEFLKGTFSNQDDLISADITGISLATKTFGQDLINTGKTIDLSTISTFGLPSNLLRRLSSLRGVSQDLVLALLATEMTPDEVDTLLNGKSEVTIEQEQKIYGAFLIITGTSLADSLIALNCKVAGLSSLADLLNVKKLFPTSYPSLTVPVYNGSPGPTNSKTYYLLYQNGGVSSQIQQFKFGDYLTNIIPDDQAQAAGAFAVAMQQVRNIDAVDIEKFARIVYSTENTFNLPLTSGTDVPVNLSLAKAGTGKTAIGSGVYGTLTMSDLFGNMSGLPYPWQGIHKNIKSLETKKLTTIYQQLFLAVTWEKAVFKIEQIPRYVQKQTYQPYIPPSGTPGEPDYDPGQPMKPGIFDLYYKVKITLIEPGGGYGRGKAVDPIVTVAPNNCGASVKAIAGRDVYGARSVHSGSYGRISAQINNGSEYLYAANYEIPSPAMPDQSCTGAQKPPEEFIDVQAPPIERLPVLASGDPNPGGVNVVGVKWGSCQGLMTTGTLGWTGSLSVMNDVVQNYIDGTDNGGQANLEIKKIYDNAGNKERRDELNAQWAILGTQMVIEQRARFAGIPPVPVMDIDQAAVPYVEPPVPNPYADKDHYMNLYPTSLYNFIDAMPDLSQNTKPHMQAQTIEAISNWNTPGGQSMVGQMRQERNQQRALEAGINLDNTVPDSLSTKQAQLLAANGTIPQALPSQGIPSVNNAFTFPAYPSTIVNNQVVTPVPSGYVNPNIPGRLNEAGTFILNQGGYKDGSLLPILSSTKLGPSDNGVGPPVVATVFTPENLPTFTPVPGGDGVGLSAGSPEATVALYGVNRDILPNQSVAPVGGANLVSGTTIAGGTNVVGPNALDASSVTGPYYPPNIYPRGPLVPPTNDPIDVVVVHSKVPVGAGVPVSTNIPIVPGALAPTSDNDTPINLDANYTSSTLMPASYDVQDAITKVIECNECCWIT